MEVELLIRWMKPKSKEREDQERQRSMFRDKYGIEPKDEIEPEQYSDVFTYDYMTFNINDVVRFNRIDDTHTALKFNDGDKYAAKVSYTNFQSLWEGLTQKRILTIKDNRLPEPQQDY